MPAAAPVVLGYVLALAYPTYAAAIMIAATAASVVVSKLTAPKGAGAQAAGSVEDRGHLINTTSSRKPLPLPYGQIELGVNRTFVHLANPYLHLICELGEGPINGLVRQDGTLYNTTATALPTSNPPLVYLDDKLFSEFGSLVHIELFTGTSSQSVCGTLQSATAKWDQALRYTAYLYVRLEYDRDEFKSVPEIRTQLQGLRIYNPVTTSTAYTNNPALCAYDFLTRSSQRGGIGIAAARILSGDLSDAIDYCDTKTWTCNMPVTVNGPVADNLGLIFANYRGDILYSEAKFKFRFADLNHESVVMSLDEDDIIQSGGISSLKITQPNAQDRPNAVRLVHLSEEKRYKPDDLIVSDQDAIDAEGDYREREFKAYGLTDPTVAGRMASYHLERLRLNKTAALVAGSKAMALEALDLVQITHAFAGWTDKKFRVASAAQLPDDTVALALLEEDSTFYDDTYNLTGHNWDDTDLPDPAAAVPAVINTAYSEEIYYYRGRSFTRLVVDFDAPAVTTYPFWDYAEIWLKIASGDWRYMTRSGGNWQLDPVEEGEAYQVKIVSVSVFGQKENFDDAYSISTTIVGKTSAPSSLASLTAIANGDSVSIYSNPITDPDIEGYEIRLGAAWTGGIFISFNKNISLRLNGVRPGTHTFWAAAKGNNGQYSATPRSANVTVFIPPGFDQLTTYGSWSWDFSTGTFDNAEQVTYDGADSLKCSHTEPSGDEDVALESGDVSLEDGDVTIAPAEAAAGTGTLTGTWTGPTYDLNAIEKVRAWGDFRTAFVSAATTWAGALGTGTTWAEAIDGAKTWQEIFEPIAAGQLTATLKYKELVGDSWTEVDFFAILCAEVKARYVAVEVTLVDPSADANLYLKELNMLAYTGPQE